MTPRPSSPPADDPTGSGPPTLGRRVVLAGAAGLVLLAACGDDSAPSTSDDGDDSAPTSSDGGADSDAEGRVLVAFFDGAGSLAPGSPQRLTFGVGDSNGALVKDAPATLSFRVTDDAGQVVAPAVDVDAHDEGLPRAYYPVTFTPPGPGNYIAVTDLGGAEVTAAFTVPDEGAVPIPKVGDTMPSVATPTTTDAAGVDPICTNEPPCDLHSVSLDASLGSGPVALLVSTPAYCQTAICGPVLEVFRTVGAEFPAVTLIHAEVFVSAEAVSQEGVGAPVAPIMDALSLSFEPALFLVGADGVVADRLDTIFDEGELREHLARLA